MKYFLWGYYGYDNLGDELMRLAIAKHIVARDPNARVFVPVPSPGAKTEFNTTHIHEMPSAFIQRLKALMRMDVLLIGGGTLFIDKGRHNTSLLRLMLACYWAKLLKKPIFVIGVGVDYLRHVLSRFYFRQIVKLANGAYFRETYGFDLAQTVMKGGDTKCFRTADILYASSLQQMPVSSAIKAPAKRVGVSLMDYYQTVEPSAERRKIFVREWQSFIRNLRADGVIPVFLIFQKAVGEQDDVITNLVLDTPLNGDSSSKAEIEVLRVESDVPRAYSGLSALIAMRYHALVMASIYDIPFIGINHERKIQEVCEDFNMPCLPIESLSAQSLQNALSQISGRLPEKQHPLKDFASRAQLNFAWLEPLLHS